MGLIGKGLDTIDHGIGMISNRSLRRRIDRNRDILEESSKPFTLILAELILLIISIIYICKICMSASGFEAGLGDSTMGLIMYVFEISMLFIAINSLMGISSRKPSSWSAVMRGAGMTLIMGVFSIVFSSPLSASSMINLDIWYAAILMIPVMILMCRKNVREYYTPPMMECRPLKYWILTCFGLRLYPGDGYRLSYDERP